MKYSLKEDINTARLDTCIAVGAAIGIFLGIGLHVHQTPDFFTEVAHAETIVIEEVKPAEVLLEVTYTKEEIKRIIKEKADKYGVSYERMSVTVNCESGYKHDIQSHHILSYGREESWGVSQFHLPSKNRDANGIVITKEMALDPYQALDAMAYHFSIGNAKMWTCYRMNYMQ
jgi:hypothetical protein